MASKYSLQKTEPGRAWDQSVEASPNGTMFSLTDYLESCGCRFELLQCLKGQEKRALIALALNEEGECINDDLLIYNGIMYCPPTTNQNLSQQISEQFKLQEFVSEALAERYSRVEMSLHPSLVDVRAFLWHNYGEEKQKYEMNLRYTSHVRIDDLSSSENLDDVETYSNGSMSRRQQIRYAIQKSYRVELVMDTPKFMELYTMTMSRQEVEVQSKVIQRMKGLMDLLLEKGKGLLYACYDEEGALGSMAFMGLDSKRAYYVFGANDPEKRKGHSGTYVLWGAFEDLSKRGFKEVDLEGVNSPARGWFKQSFGGSLDPYFSIAYPC
jgi:hypothetical protein